MTVNAMLKVATPEGESGRIVRGDQDYLFRYGEGADLRSAISLLMPVRLEDYRHRELHPIFQMNLPEGYVLEQLRNRLAKIATVDPMLLLALSGSSSPIGRVTVASQEIDALLARQQRSRGERLEEILAWDGAEDLFADLVDRYILRAGISGVQPKVLVPELDETLPHRFTSKTSDLIIKSGREEFPGLAINEYLCMSVAREAGVPVPPFYLSDNARLFVMRRFDRDADLNPLGFEDMAALMGLSAEQKYSKSYSAIAKAIRLFCPPEHVQYSNPTRRDARLAPAYDIVNTTAYIPEDVLALDLIGNRSLFASRQGLLEFARVCDVGHPKDIIRRQLGALELVLEQHVDLCRQAPAVADAIRRSAAPFIQTFG